MLGQIKQNLIRLTCHPDTVNLPVQGLEAGVRWAEGGALLGFTYSLKGDLSRLQIPQPQPCRRADRLWQHTCFEAFVGEKGKSAYCEFNFSPAGEWAVYRFREYRDGAPIDDDALDPKIVVCEKGAKLELSAVIRMEPLSIARAGAALRLGLSAVVEELNGSLSYWALKHPPGKPDFHHADNFALEIQTPVDGVNAIAYTAKS